MNEIQNVKLQKACKLAQGLQEEGRLVAAFVGGSIPAGLGNSTSDVDLFALTDAIWGERVVQYNSDGDRIDVEFFTWGEAEGFLSSIEHMKLAPDNLQQIGGLTHALDWFSRLRQSSDAVSSAELDRLRAKARNIEASARHLTVAHWILIADSMAEDFRGAAAAREIDTAVYASQQMVGYAGKALLASMGDVYFPAKWVYQQIKRSCENHMAVRDFREFQTGLWANAEPPDFDGVIRATQTLSACATLETLVPGSTRDLDPPRVSSRAPSRNPLAVPVPLNGRALLHFELERQVVLSPLLFAVWVLCDGRSTTEIIKGIRSISDLNKPAGVFETDDLRTIIQSLKKQRLID